MNIIFDIDGTIADGDHRRHFVSDGNDDWVAFRAQTKYDTPIQHVCDMAKQHVADGDLVMFVSARNNSERDITIKQIQDWIGIDEPLLFMRPDGDYRPDDVFKKDVLIIIREILGSDPDVVYDDRNKVVDMWRANGINCVQVIPRDQGNFWAHNLEKGIKKQQLLLELDC